jgi:hypothetical protein
VQVKLSSVNGPLAILRKQDGRSPSPAVNLLPQKGRGDEDWDENGSNTDEDESVIDTAALNRDIAKAVKESQKDTSAARKETRKAAAQLNKEMKKAGAVISPSMPEPPMPQIEIPKIELDTEALKAIDRAEMQETLRQAMETQKEALVKLRDASFFGSMPKVLKESETFPVKGVPRVTIDAKGCAVRVRGWDRSEVQYTVTQFTDSRDRNPVSTSENHSDSAVTIKVVNSDPESRDGVFMNEMKRVRIDVFVPRKSNLKVITNGEIRVDGVSGDVELKGADEAIDVRDVDGKLKIANTDGVMRVIGFRGELNAATVNGEVFLEGDFQKLSGIAADGTYVLTIPDTANASIISNTDVESDSIAITRAGNNKWQIGSGGASYTFHFGGGSLQVRSLKEIAS